MHDLWPVLLLLALFFVYVAARIVHYARKSRQQWKAVDKTRLREWKDDDEW